MDANLYEKKFFTQKLLFTKKLKGHTGVVTTDQQFQNKEVLEFSTESNKVGKNNKMSFVAFISSEHGVTLTKVNKLLFSKMFHHNKKTNWLK